MSIGGKGNYDTEFSTTFWFCLFFFFPPQKSILTFLKISFFILALWKRLCSEPQKPLGIFYIKWAVRNSSIGTGGADASQG